MSLIVNGEKIYPEFIEQGMTVLRPKYQQTFQDQSAGQQDKQLREWAKENVIEKTLLLPSSRQKANAFVVERLDDVIGRIVLCGLHSQSGSRKP